MVARNDITGDKIQTRDSLSDQGKENWDKIFPPKKKEKYIPPLIETHKILKQESKWEKPPITLSKEEWNESRIDTIGQNGNNGEHYD